MLKPGNDLAKLELDFQGSNRLGLDLKYSAPFLYRTHHASVVKNFSSKKNKLILLSRNFKELLFRRFTIKSINDLKKTNVKDFIDKYIDRFKVYDSWDPDHRYLVFYEDFIDQKNDEILLDILCFIEEEPIFYYQYLMNKEEYHQKIRDNYVYQHKKDPVPAGLSSKSGPELIYYSKNKDLRLLRRIDGFFEKEAPIIWEKYLKRFAS